MSDRDWHAALEDHSRSLDTYLARTAALSTVEWTAAMRGRTWSPAEETLHLIKAYQLPLNDAGMRLRVSPFYAWVLRNLYLRYLLWRRTFHRGARAPSEVRPDSAEALAIPREEMLARLREIFDRHNDNGRVTILYTTELFYGRLAG